jgi:hypothetical protein
VLGDWGLAECRDMATVFQHLEPNRYGYPKPAPTGTVAPHSHSPCSISSPPTSLEPSQQGCYGTERTRGADMVQRNYCDSGVTDLDSDLDTKRPSAFQLLLEKKHNPWARKTTLDSAERTVSIHPYSCK